MNKNKFNQLEVIKEKFLALEDNAKNYTFELVIQNENKKNLLTVGIGNYTENKELYPYVQITLNILDPHNDFFQLYAQATEDGNFFITDEGSIAEEFEYKGKASLFSNHLWLNCKLDEFDTEIQDYFYMLSTLFQFLGFKWNMKNEQEEILSK